MTDIICNWLNNEVKLSRIIGKRIIKIITSVSYTNFEQMKEILLLSFPPDF